MFCKQCGKEISDSAKFCIHCGATISNTNTIAKKDNTLKRIIIPLSCAIVFIVLVVVGAIIILNNHKERAKEAAQEIAQETVKEDVIATFNGGEITKDEYDVYYKMFASYLANYGYEEDEIPKAILDKAIQDKYVVILAKNNNIVMTDEQREELEEIFNNETNLEYFKGTGIEIEALKNIYENDYLISNYVEQEAKKLENETVKKYLEEKYGEDVDLTEYDTSHILFSFTKSDGEGMTNSEKAQLKTYAESILIRALNKEDFEKLAQEYSDDSTASDGGQYIMYRNGYTIEEYENIVIKLNPGEIYSELVETEYGYHIIKLNKKVENGLLLNTEEREELTQNKISDKVENLDVKINQSILDEYLAANK